MAMAQPVAYSQPACMLESLLVRLLGADAALGGRSRGIPSGRGRLHLGRGFGLRLGGPGLDRSARGRQRRRVEARADVVALLGGFLVALAGRKREPLVGFGQILLDPDAARVEDAQIVLAVGDAVVGGIAEPLGG